MYKVYTYLFDRFYIFLEAHDEVLFRKISP